MTWAQRIDPRQSKTLMTLGVPPVTSVLGYIREKKWGFGTGVVCTIPGQRQRLGNLSGPLQLSDSTDHQGLGLDYL